MPSAGRPSSEPEPSLNTRVTSVSEQALPFSELPAFMAELAERDAVAARALFPTAKFLSKKQLTDWRSG